MLIARLMRKLWTQKENQDVGQIYRLQFNYFQFEVESIVASQLVSLLAKSEIKRANLLAVYQYINYIQRQIQLLERGRTFSETNAMRGKCNQKKKSVRYKLQILEFFFEFELKSVIRFFDENSMAPFLTKPQSTTVSLRKRNFYVLRSKHKPSEENS